ncbi:MULTISPECIES: hypothetical protein [unclassified Mycobacterium]|uniref:hypothetical protein n=1 Tax=unclassified Mycobacterium TaxID=2642494 RepID=UPI000A84CBB6|nr:MULTISPECIES: hypothetical protein [unclassified Mycobacterium]
MSTQFGVSATGPARHRAAVATGSLEPSLLIWWVIGLLIAVVIFAGILAMA